MPFHESVTPTPFAGVGTRRPRGDASRPRRARSWSRSRTGAVVLAALLVGGTAGCSSNGSDAAASASPSGIGGAASASPSGSSGAASASPSAGSATPSPSTSPTGVGPIPTPGPSVIPKVSRPGQPSRPTITAGPATFSRSVAYSDGITLKVDRVTSGVETGQGPGVFAGREFAVFTVTMTNGTTKQIDAQQVVLTSTYGTRGLMAERVYAADTGAVDFGGQLAPGASATARYAFAIPAEQLGDVRLVVDFDGAHTSAEFDGDARQAS